jgi:hypothetical protein
MSRAEQSVYIPSYVVILPLITRSLNRFTRVHCARYPPEYHPGITTVSAKYHPDIKRKVDIANSPDVLVQEIRCMHLDKC